MKLPYITVLIMGLLATSVYAEEVPVTKTDDKGQTTATTPPTTVTPAAAPTQPVADKASALASDQEKLSYSLGYNLGKNYKQLEGDLSLEILLKAIKEGWSGATPVLTAENMAEVLKNFQQQLMFKQIAKQKEVADKNLKEGETFLVENKKKEGVVTLSSGLQYKVLTSGTGKTTPKETDKVTTNYRGTLVDGTEFDSGKSVSFPVNGVIKGWTEALLLMKEGDKWQLFIPASLAYGADSERRTQGKIKPNSTLIFEVELLKVEPAAAVAPPSIKLEAPTKSEAVEIKPADAATPAKEEEEDEKEEK